LQLARLPSEFSDAENAFIQGHIKGNCTLTICNFKSLDYVNTPQSKQNVS